MPQCRSCKTSLDIEPDEGQIEEDWLKVVCDKCGEITNVSLVRASQQSV